MLETEPGTRSSSPRSVEITCCTDGRAHQIDDVLLATAIAVGSSRFQAVCGRSVLPAALTQPPGPQCPLCTAMSSTVGHRR